MMNNISFNNVPVIGGFEMEGYWVWCGSVIKDSNGLYHLFASRWPKDYPMHPGWMVASEVVRATSNKKTGPFKFEEVVLPSRGAEYWDGRSTHNPHITKYKDTYIIYYMGSTHPFSEKENPSELGLQDKRTIVARSNKRIGIAVSKSLEGPWERQDAPILDVRPGKFDSYLTSNPAPCINEDGSVLLVYKSRTYEDYKHSFNMSLGVAKADHFMGPYHAVKDTPLFNSKECHVEDPFIWKKDNLYYMTAKDMEGNICGEHHAGILATSKNGIDWTIEPNTKFYSRTITWDDGQTLTMGSMERPFILFEEGKPSCMYFATADGPGEFTNANKTWNIAIPIK